jgi:formylglycine-generating enzyme required for sulfatase activity
MKAWLRIACLLPAAAAAATGGMSLVPGGSFTLPFRGDTAEVRVKVEAFRLDRHAVTQDEYRAFVRAHPALARSRIKKLFADSADLGDWKDDATPPPRSGNAPVTQVSWYAAKAYCAAKGKRLPTTGEWEWAAKALPPGVDSAALHDSILSWYSRPAGKGIRPVGSGSLSGNGIRDLYGLVWEWTSDFDAYGFTGMNQRGVADSGAFCGAGGARAVKESEYATYMRWAFRLSLRPDYTVGSLGFRCACDADAKGD